MSRQPWSTFTLYGQTGSQLQSEIAMDAFEDDLCVMSRTVRPFPSYFLLFDFKLCRDTRVLTERLFLIVGLVLVGGVRSPTF